MSDVLSGLVPALVKLAASVLARVRSGAPRVHCITDTFAQAMTRGLVRQEAWVEA